MRSRQAPSRAEPHRKLLEPREGYWMVRVARGGPEVPAAIVRVATEREPGNPENDMAGTRSPFLAAYIGREPVAIDEVWHRKGREITADDYAEQLREYLYLQQHKPHHPRATPERRVDIGKLPPIF